MVARKAQAPQRFDIFLVDLDPTRGSEIKKVRPCAIISPDSLNNWLNTVIVAPYTSTLRDYPFRVASTLQGKRGEIATDQMRAIDKTRLKKRIGKLSKDEADELLLTLQEMFAQ